MLLPIGVSDFRTLIEYKNPGGEGYLFVDKSLFIKDVLYDGSQVIVLTRPRRFGKTLNLSMLQYFFAKEVSGKSTAGLFDGLEVAKHADCMQRQGQLPVVFITLKDVKADNFDSAIFGIYEQIRQLYEANRGLLDSKKISEQEKSNYIDILSDQPSLDKLTYSLAQLTKLISQETGKKPLMLIDEYDTPIQAAYISQYYDKFLPFMRNFFAASLKDNASISKAVLTGILRVSKESLFSGLNNVKVYSVLNSRYSNAFGFTEDEVDKLFIQVGVESNKEKIKSWYNGYQFSEDLIYNPWSIINCLSERGKIGPYWLNTSSNDLIQQQIIHAEPLVKEKFSALIAGKTITTLYDEHFVFNDLEKNQSALWSLMLMSGYLSAVSVSRTEDGEVCELKVPNREVESLYKSVIKEWLSGVRGLGWYRGFLTDLTEGRIADFEEKLKIMVEETLSYHDTSKTSQECFYHGLMLGFVAGLKDNYEIKSNRESGRGRYDVAIIPKEKNKAGIIMEFKAEEEPSKFKAVAQAALKQIEKSNYVEEMKQRGITEIYKLGISFSGKNVKVLWKS